MRTAQEWLTTAYEDAYTKTGIPQNTEYAAMLLSEELAWYERELVRKGRAASIDENIGVALQILNQNGVETAYSCSGHVEHRNEKQRQPSGFILFHQDVEIPQHLREKYDHCLEFELCELLDSVGVKQKRIRVTYRYPPNAYYDDPLKRKIQIQFFVCKAIDTFLRFACDMSVIKIEEFQT